MPKASPVSFRPTPEVKAMLAAHVADTRSNLNAEVNRLLLLGQQAYAAMPKYEVRDGPSPREVLAQAEANAAHLAQPRKRWNVGSRS